MSRLGETTRGAWTRREALEVTSGTQVDRLVHDGSWQRPWPGVYADGGIELDAEQRAFAAVLASGGRGQPRPGPEGRNRLRAIACKRRAARVYGLMLIDDDDPATGATDHRLDEVAGWAHLDPLVASVTDRQQDYEGREIATVVDRVLRRHKPVFRSGDVTRTGSGLWLTSLPRTVADCARLLTHEALVCLLDDVLHRGLLRLQDLEGQLTACRRTPGVVALRRGLSRSDGRAEAPTESLARLLLVPLLPELRPQVRLWDRQGRLVARFDLAVEEIRLAVELDGRQYHAGEVMRAKDAYRDRHAEGLGWFTERGTWWDVRCRQQRFINRVLAAAGLRAAA